ncbi:hypothetical protein C1646_771616 [Rhizophagus diaphanus]|nr:hypothetical protein C1646_771616 [Rhizophagus diaphanus] [Rhizophagus sp. MUCL 43196]
MLEPSVSAFYFAFLQVKMLEPSVLAFYFAFLQVKMLEPSVSAFYFAFLQVKMPEPSVLAFYFAFLQADLIQYKNIQIKDFMQNRYRVIVTENDEEILKIAPECIKKEVEQYSPKTDINVNIYDGLMDRITQEEMDYHISILPNGKALGPSKISYEMIKHSSAVMKSFITNYLNECLTLRKIPKE